MKNPQIGAHVSIKGGLVNAVKRAKDINVDCMQIFAGSPRKYDISFPKKEEEKKYKEEIEKSNISSVYIHASYLLNLASDNYIIRKKSIENIKKTLLFGDIIGASGVVYHPGSPKGKLKDEAIEREIESILNVLEVPSNTSLIIENTAGKKKIGTDPNEIGYIFKNVNSSRLMACIDVAHSFESGNIENFTEKEIEKWLLWWDNEVGIKNISLLHVNDSLTKSNSLVDRHANIGKGEIGLIGFVNLMKNEKLRRVPWILEVPGIDGNGPDKENVIILKKIREKGDFY